MYNKNDSLWWLSNCARILALLHISYVIICYFPPVSSGKSWHLLHKSCCEGSPSPCCREESGSQEGGKPPVWGKAQISVAGKDIQLKKALHWFVKWPRCTEVEWQNAILSKQWKVPPAVNQFTRLTTPWRAERLHRRLSWPSSRVQRQSKRLLAVLEKKAVGKGMSPLRGHMSFKQDFRLSPPW